MKKIVVSSIRANAGKTSIIAGIVSAVKDRKFAYAKPLGDRLIYRRKRSWDYDASLMVSLLRREGELESRCEKITFGFDHSRLKYMYDQEGIKKALAGIVAEVGGDNDVLFLESGKDLASGSYLNLDPVSMAGYVAGKLVIVVSGDSDSVLDDAKFIERHVKAKGSGFGGVIINKVNDPEAFEYSYAPAIKEMGIDVFGVIPYQAPLTWLTLDLIAEKLLARVIAGEKNLRQVVKKIIIGKLRAAAADKPSLATDRDLHEDNQLMICSGERSDIILAALERDTAGIILTNDIVPPQNIIARAEERGIPMLLVGLDTLKTARAIDDMEVTLRREDTDKLQLLSQLVEKHLRLEDLLK